MEKAVDEVISRLAEIEDTANRMNEACLLYTSRCV